MTKLSPWLGALAALSSLAACAAPATPPGASASGDKLLTPGDGNAWSFKRALVPTELGFQQADATFDTSQYVAYWFQSTPGPVELTTWRDYQLKDFGGPMVAAATSDVGPGGDLSDAQMAEALFEWNPRNGSDDMADGRNWALLQINDTAAFWTWKHGDVDSVVNLPHDTRYLLVVLGSQALYDDAVQCHTQMTALPPGGFLSSRSGWLAVHVHTTSGLPAAGLRVSIGTTAYETDDHGIVNFFNLRPNTYTVGFGPDASAHADLTVLSGTISDQERHGRRLARVAGLLFG